MNTKLFIFEDDDYEHFYPLTVNRPVFLLLSGIFPIWEKWKNCFDESELGFLCRGEVANFTRETSGIRCNRLDFEGCQQAIFVNGRIIPDENIVTELLACKENRLMLTDGNLSAAIVECNSPVAASLSKMDFWGFGHFKALVKDLPKSEIKCARLEYIWDFIGKNAQQIKSDIELFPNQLCKYDNSIDDLTAGGCLIYNADDIYVDPQASIDGQTVLDARGGPIVVAEGVHISAHSRIEGPCYIGPETQIVGGKIREGCSFGPLCRVGGEVEESVFQGYSNKYHEGFLGHAFLGEWVNLGALTTNSDLKNNYGTIKIDIGLGLTDTGLMKVGSFIGDHVKTGIGTLLNTGIVIGFAANIFGGGLIAEKCIPPFVWGGNSGYSEYMLDKALETAEKAMARRKRELSPANSALFKHIFETTAEQRNKFCLPAVE